jgi:hypothetical protein
MDDKIIDLFSQAAEIVEGECLYFEHLFGVSCDETQKLEVFLFNLYYTWKFIQDKRVIPMTPISAQLFISSASVKLKEMNISIDIMEFHGLYKNRFENHNKEYNEVMSNYNTASAYPNYFYMQIGIDDLLKSNSIASFTEHDLTLKYIDLVKHMDGELETFLFNPPRNIWDQ